jgi:murein DD-endopeptidase MepM/ murein hydrolase activator NlpD
MNRPGLLRTNNPFLTAVHLKIFEKAKKSLPVRFTFMLIPHGVGKPRQINLHLSVLLVLFVAWTAVTFWGSYLSAQHVDYWRTQVSNQVLKLKVQYLMAQLDQTRGFIDEVKTVEGRLRELLRYAGKDADHQVSSADIKATGGPTAVEQNDVTRLLMSANTDVSWERLIDKVVQMRSEARERVDRYNALEGWINEQRRLAKATPTGWPCQGRLTSHYGRRGDPLSGENEFHAGIDIAAAAGTPVRATADGWVRVAGWQSGYGNLVVLQHNYGFSTRYGHNSRLLVRAGEAVKRGQVIALMGSTGHSSGPHCHYEVWHNNERTNPYAFVNGSRESTPIARIIKNEKPQPS